MTPPPARPRPSRKRDSLSRLTADEDAWVATASPDGVPTMVPLSFLWVADTLLMATRATNPTAVNIARTGHAVISLGSTRDVVLIEAGAEVLTRAEVPEAEREAFTAKLGWSPPSPVWCYLRFRPRSLRAWRENELSTRLLMENGTWLV
ncbi:pyridoxamine 5'-phosphate oxidase family protein [Streptomyces carpaticus]|uniref:Pyridoxamine 5'-phosphate oxidase family protein n=1 Tax=Streptomyces carpaticus TaxID=285558 RepID=A0ABV4ZRZ4_9ACTN